MANKQTIQMYILLSIPVVHYGHTSYLEFEWLGTFTCNSASLTNVFLFASAKEVTGMHIFKNLFTENLENLNIYMYVIHFMHFPNLRV